MAPLQLSDGGQASVLRIDVDDDETGLGTGAHGDAVAGSAPPPAGDGLRVGGGVVEPPGGPSVLAGLEQSARRQEHPVGPGSWHGKTAQPWLA